MVRRPGHSLVELLVALVLASVGFGAIGSSAVLGARWTARGIARQEALAAAEVVLDSILDHPAPTDGHASRDGIALSWTIRALGPGTATADSPRVVRLSAVAPGLARPVTLAAIGALPPPVLAAEGGSPGPGSAP